MDKLERVLDIEGRAGWKATLEGLGRLGLEPEVHWHGDDVGWGLRFRFGRSTVCSLLPDEEDVRGALGFGARVEAAVRADPKLPRTTRLHLDRIARRGGVRWVEVPVLSRAGQRAFLGLVAAKLRALG